jgi:DNA-binding GntR family transcriptional regulator
LYLIYGKIYDTRLSFTNSRGNMIDSNETFQQQAYVYIKEQIVNLVFKPGEFITDTQIANQLKVSRTPIREAFYRLEKEGLLIYEARRGWKVYSLSLDDIHEIFDIKEVLEGMVARQAAECKNETLRADLREALKVMQAAAEAGNSELWLQADRSLHDILFEMAGNERAARIIANLNDQWHRVRVGFIALQGRTHRSAEEHRLFVESILVGNGEEAEQRMRAHLNEVRKELVHLLVTIVLPYVDDGV